ncbi:MAG: hypothetical protein ABFD24_05160 [Anaerolineaceae bacterium]
MKTHSAFDLLSASGPFIAQAEKLMLYGQFVGTWNVESVWYKGDKVVRKAKRSWVFDWILGGRGIQDVLFAEGVKPSQYGTTLRVYDELLDAWHITWMCPEQGEFVNLLARRIGDRIVQEGLGGDYLRRERWSFTEITPDSFVWLGEVSFDRGGTWVLEQRMKATRVKED